MRSHPTAAELYESVRHELPRVSLGTVYRVLRRLSADAAVQTIQAAGASARFDADTSAHHHVRCARCGRVDDLPAVALPDIVETFRASTEYELIGLQLELTGICPRCCRRRGRG